MDRKSTVGLLVFLLMVYGVAALGALATSRGVPGWYADLQKPTWTPPSWVFGPAWTLLYGMMAVAGWLVWRRGGWSGAPVALSLFAVQLVLNAAWSPVFFGQRSIGGGLLVILALWPAILATLVAFWRHAPVSGALLAPYQLWVTYAGALNLALWRLNA